MCSIKSKKVHYDGVCKLILWKKAKNKCYECDSKADIIAYEEKTCWGDFSMQPLSMCIYEYYIFYIAHFFLKHCGLFKIV